MKATKTIAPRYAETDQMGVIHHATYLLYFEDARTAYLDALGIPYREVEARGFMSPVVSMEVNYGASLVYGKDVRVEVWVSKVTPAKVAYSYAVYQDGRTPDGRPCATATSVHCLVDRDGFKPVSMKRALPDLYQRYRQAAETGD